MDKPDPNELVLIIGIASALALMVVIAAQNYHAGRRRLGEEKSVEEIDDEERGGLLKPDPWTDPE